MPARALALLTLLVAVVGAAGTAASDATNHAGRVVATADRPDGAVDVRYRSIGTGGGLVEQLALLWHPTGPPSGDVVAWGHASTGLADGCAPSAGSPEPSAVPGLDDLRRAGHVVVAPDYEGLGTPGEHPYLVGDSAARSILDALRAARSVTGADGRSVAYGWSQGGHAVLFAGRIAGAYAPDVRLAGVAALAPVTDMQELLDGRSTFARHPGFVAMVTAGFAAAYPELDVAQVLPEAAKGVAVARRSCSLGVAAALQDAPTTVPGAAWDRRLRENDPTLVALPVPALIVHGEQDALLAVDDAAAAYRRLCRLGSSVRLERLADAGHGTLPALAADSVVRWLDDRLDGHVVTGCAQRRVATPA